MKYRRFVAAQRGGPGMLQIIEDELRPPAAAVSLPDVEARYGSSPFPR